MAQVYVVDCCGTAYSTAIAAEYHERADSCGAKAARRGPPVCTSAAAALNIVNERCNVGVLSRVRRQRSADHFCAQKMNVCAGVNMNLPLDVFKYIIPDYRTLLAFRCTCKDATGATAAVSIIIRTRVIHVARSAVKTSECQPTIIKTYLHPSDFAPTFISRILVGYDIYIGGQYAATVEELTNDSGIERFARLAALTDRDCMPFSGTPVDPRKKEYLDKTTVAGCVRVVNGIVFLPPRVVIEYYDPVD